MATLIFTALGTIIGGPIGGVIGALAGRQIDSAIFGGGGGGREGPRLKELSVTTSSYGTPIARHHGRMRVAGSIIWSTDLIEHKDTQGGGKGRPSVTTYTYSASFAVALASRPLKSIGRIWADGNLLRGAAGDLKVGGKMRFYPGAGNQRADPLMEAAEAQGLCPAYRDLAYVVFEDLQLADFGNRIPALTFEVIAGDETISLGSLVDGAVDKVDGPTVLDGVSGVSCEGPLADLLRTLDPVFPIDCDVSGTRLTLGPPQDSAGLVLPEPSVAVADDSFGAKDGFARKRSATGETPPGMIRYYDIARDFQPGLQRASGRPLPGQPSSIELPIALEAGKARTLVDMAVNRASWSRQSLSWRTSEVDPLIRPGSTVRVPGQAGLWRVVEWEWREGGVELGLIRHTGPNGLGGQRPPTDPGRSLSPPDLPSGTTLLAAFDLPWDGTGAIGDPTIYVAASSDSPGWTGAALYMDPGDGQLVPAGTTGRTRAVIGQALSALEPANPTLFDRSSTVDIQLAAPDLVLSDASLSSLASGTNRALLGREIVQFVSAVPLGPGIWRLSGFHRGLGGTESAAASHGLNETFVLLNGEATAIGNTALASAPNARVAATGLGDAEPAYAVVQNRGIGHRPPCPVHPWHGTNVDGSLSLRWTRRARGAWIWQNLVDAPLNEEAESYEVLAGPVDAPVAAWTTSTPNLTLSATQLAAVTAALPHAALSVRQRGSQAVSETLFLVQLP